MNYVLTGDQMKAADGHMIREMGVPSLVLMERAALRTVEVMEEQGIDFRDALIVCGSGNNGGDGFAIARLLFEKGYQVNVFFAGKESSRSEESRTQMEILARLGVKPVTEMPDHASVVIDALFGIGLARDVEGRYAEIIAAMNAFDCAKVAVDIASGVSADTGNVLGCAFRADFTVTFAFPKIGQILYPGCEYSGKTFVRQIGILDPGFADDLLVLTTYEKEDIRKLLPQRSEHSNKGTYGKVLLIAGSRGMSGAAFLSAKAAYRMGAGLVRIYTEESNREILQQLIPEAVITTYDGGDPDLAELIKLMDWANVVSIGSGLGMSIAAEKILTCVLDYNKKPGVIDADALNLIAKLGISGGIGQRNPKNYILTPHMREMSRISGFSVKQLEEQRFGIAQIYAMEHEVILALKDSRTLVCAHGEHPYLNSAGNSALAKAGSGDVLAGIITGLLAQKLTPYHAAALGVYLHSLCGDAAREENGAYSPLAGELSDFLPKVLRDAGRH